MRGNRLVIWNVNGSDGAGWKPAVGRRGCPSKGQSLCRAVLLWMPVGRYELLRLTVSKIDRLSNGWAGQAHARQPWGEWLPGTLAVKMAVRVRQVDRTVRRSHWWP